MSRAVSILALSLCVGCGGSAPEERSRGGIESGPPIAGGSFIDGKRDGHWAVHYRRGPLAAEGSYELGKRTGTWRFTHPDGERQATGSYRDGKRHGRWQVWASDGSIVSDTDYERGRRVAVRVDQPVSTRGWQKRRCSQSEVSWRLKRRARLFDACFRKAGAASQTLHGRWAIDSDGIVSDVVVRGGADAPALMACVEAELWKILYPMPHAGRCVAEWSFYPPK